MASDGNKIRLLLLQTLQADAEIPSYGFRLIISDVALRVPSTIVLEEVKP
ncbi:hypothetical protein CCACVL1_00675 [Corchorus capsularis]|uniref:Uncharacterized protein n=1 Tax=Corchorus capsularis TaxID=210143 RepID=A0A1R3KVH9_COCAP|nr:hypothetical protein CCACVL1_00675 [Corchorus capsularis]